MLNRLLKLRQMLFASLSLATCMQFANSQESSKQLDLLIVAGQSNATGFDTDPEKLGVDELDALIRFRFRVGDPPPDEHDSSSATTQWTTLRSQPRGNPGPKSEPRQYGNFVNPKGGFGPEVAFARKIKRRDKQNARVTELAVVKAAFSGTSVADDWDPAGEGKRGACYRALVEEIRAAKSLAEAEGFNVNFRGLAWVQGESDANPNDAPKYAERLKIMFNSLRRDIHAERLPVLISVNVHFHEGKNKFMPEIIAAQKRVGHELTDCRYVDTSGAAIANDVHFNSEGTNEVGKRFASALLSLENENSSQSGQSINANWTKHVVYEGAGCVTAIAGDFNGDGLIDIVCNAGKKTQLLVAPDWKPIVLSSGDMDWIHSETMDVDGDGDLDVIGTPYSPGRIVWLECPSHPLTERWNERLIDDQVNGVHGLLVGNVDNVGRLDLLATSAQPTGPFPYSLVWYRIPENPRAAERWERFVFASGDAPGLSHYLGVGDIDGDGLPDAASAAKGDGTKAGADGQWFAWWRAGKDPTKPWVKEVVSAKQPGATNIHPADVNGDGKMDLIASRGHSQGVVWFERNANSAEWTEHTIDGELREPHCLAAIDLDRDGDVDVATVAYGSEKAMWYENDGRGNFKSHRVGEKQQAYDIRIIDLDRDGDLDFVVAGRASNNVVWYENPN
jgi:Carbohydrate esterase, sialic acid-specific acetylesterase/FG-GAP-like repeat